MTSPLAEEQQPSVEAIAETNAEAPSYPWGDVTNGGVMGGLSKREPFAAMALQGLLANEGFENSRADDIVVEKAAQYADKLLKELAR